MDVYPTLTECLRTQFAEKALQLKLHGRFPKYNSSADGIALNKDGLLRDSDISIARKTSMIKVLYETLQSVPEIYLDMLVGVDNCIVQSAVKNSNLSFDDFYDVVSGNLKNARSLHKPLILLKMLSTHNGFYHIVPDCIDNPRKLFEKPTEEAKDDLSLESIVKTVDPCTLGALKESRNYLEQSPHPHYSEAATPIFMLPKYAKLRWICMNVEAISEFYDDLNLFKIYSEFIRFYEKADDFCRSNQRTLQNFCKGFAISCYEQESLDYSLGAFISHCYKGNHQMMLSLGRKLGFTFVKEYDERFFARSSLFYKILEDYDESIPRKFLPFVMGVFDRLTKV